MQRGTIKTMKVIAENKRALFDYDILEKFTAGIVLTGHEAKSIKMGRVQIAGARVILRGNQIFVAGMEIPSFQPKNAPENYDQGRTKKLLLNKKEIDQLMGETRSGTTIIPVKVISLKNKIKLEIALARGLKKHDKREKLKEKEMKKDIRRVTH